MSETRLMGYVLIMYILFFIFCITSLAHAFGDDSTWDKPLTAVGTQYHVDNVVTYKDPDVLVSGARVVYHQESPKPVITQKEMNELNKHLAVMDKAMNDIQANQAKEITGTMEIEK